ncbi:MAG: glycoside hydrolase N-terminal domain-containing protein [Luteolibacter sp.]
MNFLCPHKTRIFLFTAATLLTSIAPAQAVTPAAPVLWYAKPAQNAMNEALPVGNGHLGAMVFGEVERERLQLNEDSLWSGDNSDGFNNSGFGAYQTLGDLYLDFATQSPPTVTCPSGQKSYYAKESIASSIDGDPESKWCVDTGGQPVVWQAMVIGDLSPLTTYTFTTANDSPERDPHTWELSGSQDGQQWTSLDRHDNEPAVAQRREARTYTFKNQTAYRYYRVTFLTTLGSSKLQLAEIALQRPNATRQAATNYRRELDLSTATATTRFTRDGVPFVREVFASHPDDVIVVRWSSPKAGAVSGTIDLKDSHGQANTASGDTLAIAGALGNGLRYATTARVIARGGRLTALDHAIRVIGADEIVVLLSAGTDHVFDFSKNNKSGLDPAPRVLAAVNAASRKSPAELQAAHRADHQSLYNRVSANLGISSPAQRALPTDLRKVEAATTADPELEALLFQYGRYLLIGCSRPGSMPANLQGLWNDSNTPAWNCDYHANINFQMNYWGAETANLSECHLPMFDFITNLLEPWRTNTRADKEFALPGKAPLRGWAIRTGVNPWGAGTFVWDKTANAWLCQHFWEHYAFTGDTAFLRKTGYPVIKETVEFWEDYLKALPDGRLVVPNGWSPEHGPHEDGVSYNQQIVWDLFNNYVQAADVLRLDRPYRDKIATMRDQLVGPKIGKWGQLQEWMEDKDDLNDHHRHTSNLFAVYPGRQVSVSKTPDFAAAAKKSLDARGPTGDVREWSFAWRTSLYARLHDAESAHDMLQNLFSNRNTCLNLFGLHPPMQMDGNFGITAGIAEMLVQSHEDEINLLPALPKAWPEGRVTGLRARGGFEVSITWKNGRLTAFNLRSLNDAPAKVRYGNQTAALNLKSGESVTLDANLKRLP